MTTLHVHFPSHWKGWNIESFVLTSNDAVADTTTDALHVRVEYAHSADYYCDSPVFKAWATIGSQVRAVALKFALRDDFIDDLKKEAVVYSDVLGRLQGTVVPKYYGFYTGLDEDGQPIACLMLEHYGECLQRHFEDLSLDTRILIFERLRAFHQSGLLHGDFAERNVLQDDSGDIRLIDFDQTEIHECCGVLRTRPGQKLPDYRDVCCEWLQGICSSYLRIWDDC